MNTHESTLPDTDQTGEGDVIRALSHLTSSIGAADEILDQLSKRLDLVLLDSPDPSMVAVAKDEQSRSPLAQELQTQAARIIAHRLLMKRLCDMIQL